MKLVDKLNTMMMSAKLKKKGLLIYEIRYATVATEIEIGEDYVHVLSGYEYRNCDEVGKNIEYQNLWEDGKVIALDAINTLEIVPLDKKK